MAHARGAALSGERAYRFLDIGLAGLWGVFHGPTMTRVPGFVSKDHENALYVYERHMKPTRSVVKLTARTVRELSAKVENYFASGLAEPELEPQAPIGPKRRKVDPNQREIF